MSIDITHNIHRKAVRDPNEVKYNTLNSRKDSIASTQIFSRSHNRFLRDQL